MTFSKAQGILIAIAGAAVGGAVGYLGFRWFLSKGFYALVLPGGLMGIGASIGRVRSLPFAFALAVIASAFGLYAEWSTAPFKENEQDLGFLYLIQNIHRLNHVTILMIVVGAIVAFWGAYDPWGRSTRVRNSA